MPCGVMVRFPYQLGTTTMQSRALLRRLASTTTAVRARDCSSLGRRRCGWTTNPSWTRCWTRDRRPAQDVCISSRTFQLKTAKLLYDAFTWHSSTLHLLFHPHHHEYICVPNLPTYPVTANLPYVRMMTTSIMSSLFQRIYVHNLNIVPAYLIGY